MVEKNNRFCDVNIIRMQCVHLQSVCTEYVRKDVHIVYPIYNVHKQYIPY